MTRALRLTWQASGLTCALALALTGCGGDDDGPAPGRDAGGTADAGGVDGGGPGEDGGPGPDGGAGSDAGDTIDGGPGSDGGSADAGPGCGTGPACASGQECCARTGTCYDSRCLSCCMGGPFDAGPAADAAISSFCATVRCAAGTRCCEALRMCIPDRVPCPGEDAGLGAFDAGPTGCTPPCTGINVCCPRTNTCYDPRCLSCCMFTP